jgi:outer membrane receptor protein involved in Fe transport
LLDLQDYTAMLPNVSIGDGQLGGSINIRGMGAGTDRSFEQSVAMFIDNIYMPRSRQYRAPFFDVDRVEIMRGPQSVLYGLNATAGTISITSASTMPGDEFTASVTTEYEMEYDGYRTSLVTGGSPGDSVGVRLAARHSDNGDGFYENSTTGKDEGSTDETVLRGTVVWDATDNLRITTKADWADVDTDGGAGESFAHTSQNFGSDGDLDWVRQTGGLELLSQVNGNGKQSFEQDLTNIGVTAVYSLGDYELTAIVGYSDASFDSTYDVAVQGRPFFATLYSEDFDRLGAEFRIASDPGNTFSYIAGLYVSDEDLDNTIDSGLSIGGLINVPGQFINLGGIPNAAGFVDGGTNKSSIDTISPFFSGTYQFRDDLRLIAGIRYSDVEKDLDRIANGCTVLDFDPATQTHIRLFPLPACEVNFTGKQDQFSSDNWMPEIIVQWDIGDNGTSYAKAGRSVKSGGHTFATSVPDEASLTYDDEKATTYELGYKAMMMDDRLQVNAAVFFTQYDDLQVNSFTADASGVPQAIINNAGESEAKGIELEINFAAFEWLKVGTSLGYLDHEYKDHEAGACGFGAIPDGSKPGTCDHTGEDTPFAPEYSAVIYADVEHPLSQNLVLTAGVDVAYSDDYFTEGTITSDVMQDSYTRVDARIGIASASDTWSLSLIGKNLDDTTIIASGQSFGVESLGFGTGLGYLNTPKTITLQAKYNF